MGSYLEQSATMFLEMQQQLQRQTRNLFGNFTFSGLGTGKADETPSDESQGNSGKG
jgi:polyhydroxyalkanoate synthesis regulator protein